MGDIITKIDGQPAPSNLVLEHELEHLRPGKTIELGVLRDSQSLNFTVTLDRHPLEVIRPERQSKLDPEEGFPLSFPMELDTIATGTKSATIKRGFKVIDDLPSLADARWEIVQADEGSVEFRYRLDNEALAAIGQTGALEIYKRYLLPKLPDNVLADETAQGYHLELEIEIRTIDSDARQVAYRLEGPNGLPLEGWWYISKSGARDVVLRTSKGGPDWHTAPAIHKHAVANPRDPRTKLITEDEPQDKRAVRYIGVDSQYFASVLMPQGKDGGPGIFRRATAFGLGDVKQIPASHNRTLNVGFELVSEVTKITGEAPLKHRYLLFAGPKHADILERYSGAKSEQLSAFNLAELNNYGWFGFVSRPLARVLHLFYWIVGNYGIAIVMLTLLVRSCMLPISYRATKSTQRMQALQPELKKLGERYKDNPQERVKKQQELFRKHNINPLGGCLLAFCQLPIFIGLYRCLSIDIELRQAPLVSSWQWCSNLAGPDMLFRWSDYLPSFLSDETGYLGPFMNLLPVITMILFLINQSLMTPPATDEQTQMQQKIMKYMTIFMGFMFFKVPAGLCVYFIASSLWSLAEHKILRKGKTAVPTTVTTS
ncbi:MAG: YidC/Oxa1 family insertase periplasmic-domain containing protein [Planctomycetota bacterium]